MNSRQKGARGEREAAHYLAGLLGVAMRRGQQFSGSPDSPDITGWQGVHVEVKRVQSLNISKAMAQAVQDAGQNVPLVMHRKNNEAWMLTIRASDLARFIKANMPTGSN